MSLRHAGFSILELVIVVVVVAVAAVAIGSGFAYIARSQQLSADLQTAAQIAQECADSIVGRGRVPGAYATVAPVVNNSIICNGLPAVPGGFVRTVNISTLGAGVLCTAGWACKRVEIIVVRGGRELARLNYMLVNY